MSIWVVVHKEQSKVLNFSNLDYLEAVLLLSDSVNNYTILLIPLTPTFICILNLSLPLLLSVSICLVSQSCLTLCNPMDCSLPGSSVHGNSPGKNTEVGCHALLQGIFPTRGSNPGFAGRFFTIWATREAQEYWSGYPISSPGDLPDPGIKPRSPALHVDSLPAELPMTREPQLASGIFFKKWN